MTPQEITVRTRATERQLALLFSEERPFSAHLSKWEDPLLPDKYDFNCFSCSGQPAKAEIAAALQYQKECGAAFLKLESDAPLEDSFGLEQSVTLTMTLQASCDNWRQNPRVTVGTPIFAGSSVNGSIDTHANLYSPPLSALYYCAVAFKNRRADIAWAYLKGTLVGIFGIWKRH